MAFIYMNSLISNANGRQHFPARPLVKPDMKPLFSLIPAHGEILAESRRAHHRNRATLDVDDEASSMICAQKCRLHCKLCTVGGGRRMMPRCCGKNIHGPGSTGHAAPLRVAIQAKHTLLAQYLMRCHKHKTHCLARTRAHDSAKAIGLPI